MSGIFGIITNCVLVIIKLFIGIISASISIIADAINNLSDMGSSLLTIIGFKISNKPADKDHPYGHQRVEYIISLIIAMIIAFVGLELLTTSIDKIINPEVVKVDLITFIVLGVAIVLKALQGLFYLSASKKINSLSLKASAKDSINDCISTTAVLVGTIISKASGYNVDGIVVELIFRAASGHFLQQNPGKVPDPQNVLAGFHRAVFDDGGQSIHHGIRGLAQLAFLFRNQSRQMLLVQIQIDNRIHPVKHGVRIVIHRDDILRPLAEGPA
jgi:hypothetical protein